jgi:sulfite reductase (ferredoxin)
MTEQTVNNVVETKAEKSERLKREKDPWEALEEIRSFARNGRECVTDAWADMYFKWWGIYTQGDGQGALGKASPYFMFRIGLPNGIVNSRQLRMIGQLAQKHARNQAAITVRQSLQFHWVTIESIPKIMDALQTVGLTSKGTSGDVLRGVTGCPLAGCLPDELIDASSLVRDITKGLSGNPAYHNLPRKIKVSVSGCSSWCHHPEINDIGLTAVRHGDEVGYSIRVGGGLSRQPHLGIRLNAFIHQDQALDVVRAVMELFKRQDILRQKRENARIKYLFMKFGWTAEKFLAEVEAILGYKLDPAVPESIPSTEEREHLGIHPQKQPGIFYMGIPVAGGILSGEQLLRVADLAEQYAQGEVRLSAGQNLLIPFVEERKCKALAAEMEKIGLPLKNSAFRDGTVACTGAQFCKLGIVETKDFSTGLIAELEKRMPSFPSPLTINVTGCGNGCAHHHVSDIGLEGRKIKVDGQSRAAYSFRLGGALGKAPMLSRTIGYQCTSEEVPDAIERLLHGYLHNLTEGETVRDFLRRSSNEELRALFGGEARVPQTEK